MSVKAKLAEPVIAPVSSDEASVNEFLSRVDSCLDHGGRVVQVDCVRLARVTSNHINALWLARERCGRSAADFELINVSAGLRRVLDVLDLSGLFFSDSTAPEALELEIAPAVDTVDEAMSQLVGFLARHAVPEVTAFEIQTIFYEVATNVRRHGQLPDGTVIRLHARIWDQTVTLTFTDRGVPFDSTIQDPDVDIKEASRQRPRRGFGLAMIKRLSDSVSYERTTEGDNKLRIRKGW